MNIISAASVGLVLLKTEDADGSFQLLGMGRFKSVAACLAWLGLKILRQVPKGQWVFGDLELSEAIVGTN